MSQWANFSLQILIILLLAHLCLSSVFISFFLIVFNISPFHLPSLCLFQAFHLCQWFRHLKDNLFFFLLIYWLRIYGSDSVLVFYFLGLPSFFFILSFSSRFPWVTDYYIHIPTRHTECAATVSNVLLTLGPALLGPWPEALHALCWCGFPCGLLLRHLGDPCLLGKLLPVILLKMSKPPTLSVCVPVWLGASGETRGSTQQHVISVAITSVIKWNTLGLKTLFNPLSRSKVFTSAQSIGPAMYLLFLSQ